jgi:hypothetical protein
MPRFRLTATALLVLGAVLLSFLPRPAHAAITGNVAGVVTDQATGKPLAGVTVTVSGPALQGEQTEFTDASGRYIVTELPPGEYVVRFYFANIKVERPGVFLNADKTLPVNASIPTQKASTQTYRIVEKAPSVDVANTQVQTQVTSELVRSTPFGRNYNAVLTLAPGAAQDAVGFSFGGATGPENNFLIDGANTTSPSFGLIGTNFSLEFVKETEIITGGYNAEYGRATGGVVNVITKSGSNDFHGGAWFFYTPFQLRPPRVGRIGEAVASTAAIPSPTGNIGRTRNAFDFGFDLGGPIAKDKVWFYVGFHPQFTSTVTERYLRRRLANDLDPSGSGAYQGDLDPNQKCPPWLDPAVCPQTPGFATEDIPGRERRFALDTRTYQYIGKLNFQLNPNHQLVLQYLGTSTSDERLGVLNGATEDQQRRLNSMTHDAKIHWIGKFLDRKLQVDLFAAYHGEATDPAENVKSGVDPIAVTDLRRVSLSEYEAVPECEPRVIGGRSFTPCPVTNYRYGGIGFANLVRNHRGTANLGLTYFLRAAGTHGIKFGFDFEENVYRNFRFYTGGQGLFQILPGNAVFRVQFATERNGQPVLAPGGFDATTTTTNESFYLRDSWNVGFVPGLTLNAGVRWELQQVRDINGNIVINIPDNVAPRVGFVYDFTKKGLSKLYGSYGRFYESIPLDINDRQFSGEGLALQVAACPTDPSNPNRVDVNNCNFPAPTSVNGGTFGAVSPVLRGQFTNEVVGGIQYDVGADIVLGAAYQYRNIGRVIEDLSTDGGSNYIIANPGDPTSARAVTRLEGEIRRIENDLAQTTDPARQAELRQLRQERSDTLARYRQVASFPRPRREYHALVVTLTKRFSRNFSVLASYTFSRTFGNYPGTFSASNGQLDPNISSQYDLPELLLNRDGPLPNDRPHNLKVTGSYVVPFRSGGLTIGVNFGAQSGTPIEVLGGHPAYGRFESFLLPRGSGGRTPFLTFFDLRLAYFHQFSKLVRFEVSCDIFNLFNQRSPITVDNEYTSERAQPISSGNPSDLALLRNVFSGAPVRVNPNYGQPLSYQAPLSLRLGVRLSF